MDVHTYTGKLHIKVRGLRAALPMKRKDAIRANTWGSQVSIRL